MKRLQAQYLRLLSHLNTAYERSLMDRINWHAQLIGIRGARGVGKTTLLLQHLKKEYGADPNVA